MKLIILIFVAAISGPIHGWHFEESTDPFTGESYRHSTKEQVDYGRHGEGARLSLASDGRSLVLTVSFEFFLEPSQGPLLVRVDDNRPTEVPKTLAFSEKAVRVDLKRGDAEPLLAQMRSGQRFYVRVEDRHGVQRTRVFKLNDFAAHYQKVAG
ncbi:hypothetical protein [Ferrimonas balearica]|uniref:hypothetical protein n=1 Tax=Ferrimonas balearica TaxID=44012 RepID=UPI001C9A00BE|nr:hypothetical protein [Ferrimonas balearica]MBY5991133.1 hypothetical protein [Ferrimonas balearica]